MKTTNTLIIGASVAGLASAGSLKKAGVDFVIIEKHKAVATPWRNHYDRLHLHTNKKLSTLPFKKYGADIPLYPTRQQVVDYMESYQKEFDIQPIFETEATTVERVDGKWQIKTNGDTYLADNVIVATGPFGKAKAIDFKGMESFEGKILHSSAYKTGKDFKGQKVLVVGFGNSACEIAMAVRSAVNVLPRDILGIPILQLGLLTAPFSPRLMDKLNAPLLSLFTEDIEILGLRKLPYGPLEQIQKDQSIPLLDIGTLKLIKEGHIKINVNIDHIDGKTVHFTDGKSEDFDAIVAAIGYEKGISTEVFKVDKSRFDDLRNKVDKQKYFGEDGIYFCGFWISPTGQIREIAQDAQKIAKAISAK
jgi:indole-3-pyruvate monooxygenase